MNWGSVGNITAESGILFHFATAKLNRKKKVVKTDGSVDLTKHEGGPLTVTPLWTEIWIATIACVIL